MKPRRLRRKPFNPLKALLKEPYPFPTFNILAAIKIIRLDHSEESIRASDRVRQELYNYLKEKAQTDASFIPISLEISSDPNHDYWGGIFIKQTSGVKAKFVFDQIGLFGREYSSFLVKLQQCDLEIIPMNGNIMFLSEEQARRIINDECVKPPDSEEDRSPEPPDL